MAYATAVHRLGVLNLQFLDRVGNGGNDINMNVDGSVTPQVFKLLCPTNFTIQLTSISVFIQDASKFKTDTYGKLATLTNGIKLEYLRGTAIIDATSQLPIRSSSDWLAYAFNSAVTDFGGGQEILALEYNLEYHGRSIKMSPGDEFRAIVRDDLTGLTKHYIKTSFVIARN